MFRVLTLLLLLSAIGTSGYHRSRARRSGTVIARRQEGARLLMLRTVLTLPLLLGLLAYLVQPAWMAWAVFPAPTWLRWLGFALGATTVPLVHWVLRTLGRNVSETVLTKPDQELVVSGPYRWIRHPLYTSGLTLLLAIGLLAANWFLLLCPVVAAVVFRRVVIPLEEEALRARFGDRYTAYMARTGRFLPRLVGRPPSPPA